MLILPIKKKWFEMIRSGEKKEEYREIKPYYDTRFRKYLPRVTEFRKGELIYSEVIITFRNGYSKNSPSIKCLCELRIGQGKTEWGAEDGKRYYILKIEKIFKEVK